LTARSSDRSSGVMTGAGGLIAGQPGLGRRALQVADVAHRLLIPGPEDRRAAVP
jgi:hypothetical protein